MQATKACNSIIVLMKLLLLFHRYHGWWFGQKENGAAGFFERAKAIEIDNDDQGKLQVCLLFIKYAI